MRNSVFMTDLQAVRTNGNILKRNLGKICGYIEGQPDGDFVDLNYMIDSLHTAIVAFFEKANKIAPTRDECEAIMTDFDNLYVLFDEIYNSPELSDACHSGAFVFFELYLPVE